MIENQLLKLRQDHAMKQSQVAKELGISRAAYTYYENGQRQPNPQMLIRLAELFQVTIDYLAGRTKYPGSGLRPDSPEGILLERYRPVDSRGKASIADCALYEARLQGKKSRTEK